MARDLLMWIFSLLATTTSLVEFNLMNSQNLARMIAPNLFKEEDDLLYSEYLKKVIVFCDMVISNLVAAK